MSKTNSSTAEHLDSSSTNVGKSNADDDMDNPDMWEDEEGGTWVGDIYIPPPTQPHCSTESSGSRLMITKIVNVDFKSYAGKVILGPFHYCFTAIIGPNGSGKSNVIDSILFVFGYRANKVRAKKLSAMIHSSAAFPNVQSCSVEMHFAECNDSGEELTVIPGTEFTIGRTAFKDNQSYYTINGKQTKFKPVADLLKKYSVDLRNNRFLILQGEVEQIAMMKSKGQSENETGMLEYLEDIIGTNRYVLPLSKLNTKVEELTVERTEKHNRCNLAERDMKDLEDPYNENAKYLKTENDININKNAILQKKMFDYKKQLEQIKIRQDKIDKDIQDHDNHMSELKSKRKEKEKLVQEETAKYEKMIKEKDELESKMKLASKQGTEVQATLEAMNKRRNDNKKQITKLGEKLEELKNIPTKNIKEVEECEKKVEKFTKQKTELDEQLQKNYSKLESETQPLIEDKEKLENELIDLQRKYDDAKAEVTVTESELKILKSDEIGEKRRYDQFKMVFEESKKDLEEKKESIITGQNLISEYKDQMESMSKSLENYKQEENGLRQKILNLRSDIAEKINNMQSSKSHNKILDSLMRQKAEGKLPGILGRLGDLGGIDRKYDVAISTCCGRLDNIVVDSVNTAQNCIEHLKRHDLGRATFVALEKVNHLMAQCKRGINTPENVPRLFDLIRVEDERVLPAFYFSLRNTLVSQDLDQGTRIAYGAQRYRVVTLMGEVIETSGTMSGGGKTQLRGKMGENVQTKTSQDANVSLISQKDIDNLQDNAQDMQSRINYCQEEQGRLEKDIHKLKQNFHIKDSEIRKMEISCKSLAEQLPRLEVQLKQQKVKMDKTTSDSEKVQVLEDKITEKKTVFNEASENKSIVTKKIDEINNKINSIHGDFIKSVQTKINNISKQITTLNNNISKLKVEISTSERNVNKTEKQIEETTIEIEKLQTEIMKLVEQRTKYAEDVEEFSNQLEDAKQNLSEANKGSSSVQKEIIAIQKEESDGKLKRLDIEKEFNSVKEEYSICKNYIPQVKRQLEPLNIVEIPGDSDPKPELKTFSDEELESMDFAKIEHKLNENLHALGDKKANISVIHEYLQKRELYMERVKILEDITNKRNSLRNTFEDVRRKRYNEFMRGFGVITRRLKEMYRMITQGGDAELDLVDSMDPFNEGVSFTVRPNKKSWKNISNLSGGEKTLASLGLVFALHYYKPSPLYFMDEIDAALDFKNISIVAHYIKERTKNAQFIIISLRSNMFELSDYLVGIYKVCDCTQTICIKNTPPEVQLSLRTQDVTFNEDNTIVSENTAASNLDFSSLTTNQIQSSS